MRKILFKHNGTNVRYYKLELLLSLFGEYIIEREYGNISYKGPTGIKKNYYNTLIEAKEIFTRILHQRKKRGYCEKS